MIVRIILSLIFNLVFLLNTWSQCSGTITTYPYTEDFETSNGLWSSGGILPDWEWGAPAKPVISAAGTGNKCWVVGKLSGSKYNDSEASWIQAPGCFNFSNVQYPFVRFKVFWETEQRFDGAAFQYSTDGGTIWKDVGSSSDPVNCLNKNWFNYNQVVYLQATPSLHNSGNGWSGNIQPSIGSCQGGGGSNGWVVASHTMPYLAGELSVKFRFVFASGSICNNYDGFAFDDIYIGEAPENNAGFSFNCVNKNTVEFINTSLQCPTEFLWNFDDPASGSSNSSTVPNPIHQFTIPGTYNVSFTVSGPDNKPSTITKTITILDLKVTSIIPASCETNTDGSATVLVSGGNGNYSYQWITSPVQTTATATNLSEGMYSVRVNGVDACPADTSIKIPLSLDCSGIFFPSAFTPNDDGLNDLFGPLGGLGSITTYKLSIYNRWGERVFYSTDPFQKWDGRIKGKRADGNVFVWLAELGIGGRPTEKRKGTIMLIR